MRRRSRGDVLERAESDANKALLKAECARAAEIGIVGAPSIVTGDGEVFWGNDRLEQGLDWAARAGRLKRAATVVRTSGDKAG